MSGGYSDESARAKLSQLNESQESVQMNGQWFAFFRYIYLH